MKKALGFTLIEMIISMVLVSLVCVAIAPMIYQGIQGAIIAKERSTLDWSARESLMRLGREMYAVRSFSITTANATTFTFTSNLGEAVTYSYVGSQLLRNGDVLANNLSSFAFTYYDATGAVTAVTTNIRYIAATAQFSVSGRVSPSYTLTTYMRIINS